MFTRRLANVLSVRTRSKCPFAVEIVTNTVDDEREHRNARLFSLSRQRLPFVLVPRNDVVVVISVVRTVVRPAQHD